MAEYTAASIQIKNFASEPWEMAIALAEQYTKPIEWVERGLESCRLGNVHHSYFVDRYLKKLPDIPLNPEINLIHAELLKSLIYGQEGPK